MEQVGWTLDELVAQVAAVLDHGGTDQPNRRVRQVPDRRAIRWYTTIGLLDRPVLRGRTGWYGERHLLQLVAIKRLQAAGKPLAEIQAELAGATDATLRRIAGVPDAPRPTGHLASGVSAVKFWTTPATPPPVAPQLAERPPVDAAPQSAEPSRIDAAPESSEPARVAVAPERAARSAAAARQVRPARSAAAAPGVTDRELARSEPGRDDLTVRYALELADGVTLLLPAAPEPQDLSAVREVARPLIDQLTRRGLTRTRAEGES